MAVTLTVETEIARAEQVRASREQQQTRSPSIRRSVGACQVHSDKNKIDTRVRERLWPLSSVNRFIYWLSTGAWARIEINGRCGRCDKEEYRCVHIGAGMLIRKDMFMGMEFFYALNMDFIKIVGSLLRSKAS